MIIDAENLILGRAASFIAKRALLGDKIDIINCEKAIVIGDRKGIIAKYKQSYDRGIPSKGPFLYKNPEKFFKRTVRGMLPRKRERGEIALKNIKCYQGAPDNLKGEHIKIKTAALSQKNIHYITIKDICRSLGAKI